MVFRRPRAARAAGEASADFAAQGAFFFKEEVAYDEAAVAKHLTTEGTAAHLKALAEAFAALPEFDVASTEAALRQVAEARGLKAGTLIHAVRVAVTGSAVSPGIFEVLALVGRPRVLARLAR